jgi:hypothetical protein
MSPFSEGNCYIMTEEEVCMQLEMSYYLDAQRKGKGAGEEAACRVSSDIRREEQVLSKFSGALKNTGVCNSKITNPTR